MSDRYITTDRGWRCYDCGGHVYSKADHDAFHGQIRRIDKTLFEQWVERLPDEPTATDWQAAHDAGEDEEMRVGDLPNEEEPRKCAVCGEPVEEWCGRIVHTERQGRSYANWHDATLNPPTIEECVLCGHGQESIGGSADGHFLCHGCDEDHDCYRRWTVLGQRPQTSADEYLAALHPPRDGYVEVELEANTDRLLKAMETLRHQATSTPSPLKTSLSDAANGSSGVSEPPTSVAPAGEDYGAPDDWPCNICGRSANHSGLCCAHRYEEQEPCDACPPAADSPEPPAGTPVWWDGKWWFPDGVYYYDYCRLSMPKSWSEMPGAVPALTPQQMHDRYYVPGFSNGHARGRNDAARDIAAAREHAVAEHIALADKVSTEMLRKAEEQGQRDMLARCLAAIDHDIDCLLMCDEDTDERDCTCFYPRIVERLRALGGSDD